MVESSAVYDAYPLVLDRRRGGRQRILQGKQRGGRKRRRRRRRRRRTGERGVPVVHIAAAVEIECGHVAQSDGHDIVQGVRPQALKRQPLAERIWRYVKHRPCGRPPLTVKHT